MIFLMNNMNKKNIKKLKKNKKNINLIDIYIKKKNYIDPKIIFNFNKKQSYF